MGVRLMFGFPPMVPLMPEIDFINVIELQNVFANIHVLAIIMPS
jgi:hypothetical protein